MTYTREMLLAARARRAQRPTEWVEETVQVDPLALVPEGFEETVVERPLKLTVTVITADMQMRIIESMRVRGPEHMREVCARKQRSDGWFDARKHRITGSTCAAAAGLSPYASQDKHLIETFWPTFTGNALTRNGTLMEPFGAKSALRLERARRGLGTELAIPGLILCPWDWIFAYSADGVFFYERPAKGEKDKGLLETKATKKPYPTIPIMYYCQMQLGMYVLRLERAVLCIYCGTGVEGDDSSTHLRYVARDQKFLDEVLLPRARRYFYRRYLPMRVCFDLGMLERNQCFLPHGLKVEYLDFNTLPAAA